MMDLQTPSSLITVKEAARLLETTDRTVRRRIADGRLTGYHEQGARGLEWRVSREEVMALRAEQRRTAGGAPVVSVRPTAGDADGAGLALSGMMLKLTEAIERLADAPRIAQERDEWRQRAETLQAENEALRSALSAQQRRSWWQRLTGGGQS